MTGLQLEVKMPYGENVESIPRILGYGEDTLTYWAFQTLIKGYWPTT